MRRQVTRTLSGLIETVMLAAVLLACAPAAAPSPTAAPAKQPPATAPALQPATSPVASPSPSPAAKPEFDEKTVPDFYAGKTIRIIVGFAAGGGYDIYSRLIAKHFGKHIPGNPNVIVENMGGAGSLVAMNHVYKNAPKDGTVIGNVGGGVVVQQAAKAPLIEFDAAQMSYVGAPSVFEYLAIIPKAISERTGIRRFEDILGPSGRQFVVGATGPGGGSYNVSLVVKETLGANLKIVSGYEGTSTIRLAIERGELDGFFNSWDSVKTTSRAEVESGEWSLLVQMTAQPIKELPNVPSIMSFTKDEEQRQVLRFGVIAPNQFARLYVLPPGVPADRARALEAAFSKTMEDREFLADAEKGQQDISPLSGAELLRLIREYLAMPESINARLSKILAP